jgi:hypothetical protein
MDVGEVALEAQVEWFRHLGARGCPQLNVPHGFGVASGLASNTENGAVVSPAILDRPTDLDQLLTWLRDRADAASVIVTEPLAPAAVTQLVRSGLAPENTGNDMGRVLETADTAGSIRSPDEIQISEITDSAALPDGFRVYQADGWWDEPEEFDRALTLAYRLRFGPGQPTRHWVAHHVHRPVGAATSFLCGDTVLLIRCLVVPEFRRRGVGTAFDPGPAGRGRPRRSVPRRAVTVTGRLPPALRSRLRPGGVAPKPLVLPRSRSPRVARARSHNGRLMPRRSIPRATVLGERLAARSSRYWTR